MCHKLFQVPGTINFPDQMAWSPVPGLFLKSGLPKVDHATNGCMANPRSTQGWPFTGVIEGAWTWA